MTFKIVFAGAFGLALTGSAVALVSPEWARAQDGAQDAIGRWGFVSALIGQVYLEDREATQTVRPRMMKFSWAKPGQELLVQEIYDDSVLEQTYLWNAAGFAVTKDGRKAIYVGPGAFITTSNGIDFAFRYAMEDGELVRRTIACTGCKGSDFRTVRPVFGDSRFPRTFFRVRTQAQYDAVLANNTALVERQIAESRARQAAEKAARKRDSGGGFMAAMTGAIMGAATGYAQSGGSSVGAVAGAMGGAVVGKAGGNDALYQQMQTANAQATADAEASQRQLQRTVAQAQRGGSTAPSVSPAASSTPTSRAAPATSAASDAGAARSGAAPMTRDAYLYANMPLRDLAGANPKCVSNVFQLRFSADTKEWGDVDAKARAAAAAQFPAFVAKCNSGGKGTVQGEPSWVIADGPGGEAIRAPHVNPVDTVVRMP